MRLLRKQKPEVPLRRRPYTVDDGDGVRSSQAFSYYSHSATSGENTGRGDSPAIERIDMRSSSRKLLENRAVILASCVGLTGLILFLLALGGPPRIVTLTTSDSTYFLEDTAQYQRTAQKSIGASIINSNKLTIDTNRIARDLKRGHPEIESVTLSMPLFGRSPTVYIKPYTPSFILTTPDSKAFLLDSNGRALVSTSQISDSGELSVPTLQDSSTNQVNLGTQILPATTVSFIQTVVSALDAKKIGYSSLVLPPAANQLDVRITGKPFFVKFDLQGDALQQVGTFLATLRRLEGERTLPAEYIDVRVPERAYYK